MRSVCEPVRGHALQWQPAMSVAKLLPLTWNLHCMRWPKVSHFFVRHPM